MNEAVAEMMLLLAQRGAIVFVVMAIAAVAGSAAALYGLAALDRRWSRQVSDAQAEAEDAEPLSPFSSR